MRTKFLWLEWKAFSRSASFNVNLVIKILLGIGIFFYSGIVLFLGVAAFYGLKEMHLEPLATLNHYLIYWWAFDLVFRYFLQKAPVMQVKPFLTLPLRKKTIVYYLLGKSACSFFNFYPAFFFVPFSVVLLLNGYSVAGVICWHLALAALVFANNYLNLLVNNKHAVFITLALLMAGLGGMQYFHYLDITYYTAPLFQGFYRYPVLGLLMWVLPLFLFYINLGFFKKSLKLDDAVQTKHTAIKTEHYYWLDRYGLLGTFLKNDIKLIRRNKRAKSALWASVFFLFYGLLIFANPAYSHSIVWRLFAGIFISGGFLFTFGGFVPSWDSAYYPLMMSQNIQYKEYLSSKWWLMVFATVISTLLAAFYLLWGWKTYLAIIAGGVYNIGVNAHLVMLSGAYVKTPIDLASGRKPFGDKKAFNVQTLLLTLPKLLLPLLVFSAFYKIFNEWAGYLAIGILGILGLALRNKVFSRIEKVYKKEKYATLAAYKQKN